MRLEQRMKLSPQMIQAMEILQLPLLALQERIQQELTSNPVLELTELGDGQAEVAEEDEPAGPSRGEESAVARSSGQEYERLEEYGREHAEDLEWAERPRRSAAAGERDGKLDMLANAPALPATLIDYLLEQWAFVDAPEPVKAAGRVIITNIDEDGYFRVDLEELARSEASPAPEAFRSALPLVQHLDPPGVGARDLRECLLIQLDAEAAAGREVSLERRLLNQFLREIELNHIPQIARRAQVSVAQVKAALETLSRLEARPGRVVGQRAAPHIQPDALVELDDAGQVVVSMREGDLPHLKISRQYRKMAQSRQADAGVREFIRRNLRSAQWLMGAIAQRRQTVRRVIQEVFATQREFLERGPEALRPLPMSDIAGKLGVHVATVSRAVAGKYVQTSRGILPLRSFFSGGTTTSAGQDVSWDAIRVKLKELIDKEDKNNPLDDDQIAQVLQQDGVRIARRTVAKYRNILNIPPGRQRKMY
jgi:RNA polymerase sigma-54 factor